MNELTLTSVDIVVENQEIHLVGYDDLNTQLDTLGEYLSNIEVTPENIKENKKLVAQVRKACKELNDRRLAFKKEYMKPLQTLENQIKQLDNKASYFEDKVRSQIRDLEEIEREEKKESIKNLFYRRQKKYGNEELYPFDNFLTKQHLNKSASMNKIEEEMVEWFEKRQNDINALLEYSNKAVLDVDTVLTKYLESGDLALTMTYFNNLTEKKEQVKKARQTQPKRVNKPQPKATVLIRIAENDLDRVKQLLAASQIDFETI